MKLLVGLFSLAALAQSLPEPDIADVFYRLEGEKLVSLERQSAAIKSGAHGFIIVGMKSAQEFPGAKSPIRFKAGEPLTFIVRSAIPPTMMDPATIFFMRALKPKGKNRELVTMSGHFSPIVADSRARRRLECCRWSSRSTVKEGGGEEKGRLTQIPRLAECPTSSAP
jgi:hypothetical protein